MHFLSFFCFCNTSHSLTDSHFSFIAYLYSYPWHWCASLPQPIWVDSSRPCIQHDLWTKTYVGRGVKTLWLVVLCLFSHVKTDRMVHRHMTTLEAMNLRFYKKSTLEALRRREDSVLFWSWSFAEATACEWVSQRPVKPGRPRYSQQQCYNPLKLCFPSTKCWHTHSKEFAARQRKMCSSCWQEGEGYNERVFILCNWMSIPWLCSDGIYRNIIVTVVPADHRLPELESEAMSCAYSLSN